MSDRIIINEEIIELELQTTKNRHSKTFLFIRISKGGETEAKAYRVDLTPTLLVLDDVLERLSIIHRDFVYWLLRRLFIGEYKEKGTELNEVVQLDSKNYESMIGKNVSDNEALLILLKMIRTFLEDSAERQITILELFLSCDIHINNLQKAIINASALHKLIERSGRNYVKLIEGRFEALNEKIDDLENRNSIKPITFFNEVEITLKPPYGFILMPFKDKKRFKQSDFKDHIIPYIKDNYGIECYDVRDSKLTNFVEQKIYTCIKKSDFVIADVTGFNPNVFYELGVAHQMGKDNIVVGKDPPKNLPFDIKLFDYDEYATTDDLKMIIDSRLPSIIERIS